MNPETITTATITTPTATLRAILAALNEYTTNDKHRHILTLAEVTPLIVEQSAGDKTRPTALRWRATSAYELLTITQHVEHTLTAPALIDPAQLLAALPKKSQARHAGDTVLTLNGQAWQITTGTATTTGTTPDPGTKWPNVTPILDDQHPELAPITYGSTHLATLTKAAAHLTSSAGARLTLATMKRNRETGNPDPNGPSTWHIDTTGHHNDTLTATALHMPQRMPTR